MKHVTIKAFDLPDIWHKAIKTIYLDGDIFEVERGSEVSITKKLAVTLDIEHPENRPLLSEQCPCDMKYIEQIYLAYLFCADKTPDESYTYGERLRKPIDQIEAVISRFKEFKGDRQNTMIIRLPQDINLPDPPCLTIIDTEIFDDALHFFPYFRSWDCYGGLPANLAGLQLVKEFMAKEIGVNSGKIVAYCKNLHLYDRQFEFVKEMLGKKTTRTNWWNKSKE